MDAMFIRSPEFYYKAVAITELFSFIQQGEENRDLVVHKLQEIHFVRVVPAMHKTRALTHKNVGMVAGNGGKRRANVQVFLVVLIGNH
jgi:hypothetical protein